MGVDRFEGGDAPRRAPDLDSDGGPRAERSVLADPERRVAESCLYRALVDRVYEEAGETWTQALPELHAIRARRVEVFDRIEATRAPRDVGSVLPKSFNLATMSGDRVWVAPNATKHIWEETRGLTFGRAVSREQRLIGLGADPGLQGLGTENGYLEFKFHPSTGILIEVVLAAAPGIQVEQANFSPHNSEDLNLMPFFDSGDTIRRTERLLVIKAYSDYLYVSFGPDPNQWVGSGPVLFGLAEEQSLAAICARWTASERESVLAAH